MFLKKHIFLWLGCFFMLNLAGFGKNITEKDIQENPLFERLSSFRQRNDYFQFLQLREKQPDDAYIFCHKGLVYGSVADLAQANIDRIRTQLSAALSEEDILYIVKCFKEVKEEMGL